MFVMVLATPLIDLKIYEPVCDFWCHLYNLKSVKNNYWVKLLLVKLQAEKQNPFKGFFQVL